MQQVKNSTVLSVAEQNELERCEVVIQQGLETFIKVGTALMTIRDKRLYRAEFGTFEDYCRERWGFSRMRASQLIGASRVIANVNNCLQVPSTESQARPLTRLEPEIQREAWAEVVHENGEDITAAKVEEVAKRWEPTNERLRELKEENRQTIFNPEPKAAPDLVEQAKQEASPRPKAHVANNSGNNEWYTPSEYIESARLVMGRIDLDPASSDIANKTVKAKCFFDAEANGLNKKWRGNVWMNPPYSQPLINDFINKLISEDVEQAIVLVNNATETAWGNTLITASSAICFPKGRIRFIAPDGRKGDAPLQGQMIAYIGRNVVEFISEFEQYGVCLKGV